MGLASRAEDCTGFRGEGGGASARTDYLLQVASSDGTNTLIINASSCIHSIGFS
jgi:hypothetical protein